MLRREVRDSQESCGAICGEYSFALLKKFRKVEINNNPVGAVCVAAPRIRRTLTKIRAARGNRQPCKCKIFVASGEIAPGASAKNGEPKYVRLNGGAHRSVLDHSFHHLKLPGGKVDIRVFGAGHRNQTLGDGVQGRTGARQHRHQIFLGDGPVRWVDQIPPPADRVLHLGLSLFTHYQCVDQAVDLALDGLIRDGYFLGHWFSGASVTLLEQSTSQTLNA